MEPCARPIASRPPGARATLRFCASLVFASTLAFTGCVSEPSAITGQKKSYGYSWEQELQLGAEADKEITSEMGVYDNPAIQNYVESVGQRVLQASNFSSKTAPDIYRNTKFTFRVMDSPVVNAFALPGGYVYVTRGLLSHLENEAQLAVVLGHEIGHVEARHSAQQAKRAQIGQIGLIAAAVLGQQVLGDQVANMGDLVNLGGQAFQLFMLRYSRAAENESDTLGVTWAKRAGYAAAESSRFFTALQRLSESEGKMLPTWQSTHPDPGDRANHVRELAAKTPGPATGQLLVGEDEYLRRIEGIVVGDDPREGFTRGGVFYHPTLRFQLPVAQGWKVDNQKSAVVMADPNGRGIMGLRLAPEARAREAAAKFVEGAKIQVVASGDTVVNGLPATVVIGQAQGEQGTVGVWNAFIEMEGRVYSVLGYAPAQVFAQMRPTFEAVAGGFSPLRDPNAINVQPARLRLVRADRNAPFASFVPTSLPMEVTAEKVAIMNQVQLNEAVPAGRILKVPDTSMTAGPAPGYATPQAYPPAYPQNPYPPAAYPPAQSYPQQTPYPPATYPQNAPPNWPR